MSKRLQVLFDEEELRELQESAQKEGLPVSEWVRRALREARRESAQGDISTKLAAVRAAVQQEFPTADIEEMLAEVRRGYEGPLPE